MIINLPKSEYRDVTPRQLKAWERAVANLLAKGFIIAFFSWLVFSWVGNLDQLVAALFSINTVVILGLIVGLKFIRVVLCLRRSSG